MSLHYLIDGYNAIYALAKIPAGTWEKKRDHLIELLLREKPQGKNQATVVFDGREGSGDRSRRGDIDIVFTSGETADDWIIQQVRQVQNPRVCVVVTNDQGLLRLIRGTGAKGCSVADFLKSKVHRTPQMKSGSAPPPDADDITDELKKRWL